MPRGTRDERGTPTDVPVRPDKRPDYTMLAVRYVLPAAVALAGVLVLLFNQTINGLEGAAMGIGVGGSILLLNVLYRVGVSGDRERDEEEAARVYFDEHGRWPDE
jgi:hypothetical protein